jgi:hypothetical protein
MGRAAKWIWVGTAMLWTIAGALHLMNDYDDYRRTKLWAEFNSQASCDFAWTGETECA